LRITSNSCSNVFFVENTLWFDLDERYDFYQSLRLIIENIFEIGFSKNDAKQVFEIVMLSYSCGIHLLSAFIPSVL